MVFKHDIVHCEMVGDIEYRIPREEWELKAAADMFIDVMLSEEPAVGSKGGYPTQPPSLVKLARDILDDGVSLVAVDDGTVVGMRTSHVIQRSAARKERPSMEELLEDFPEPHAYLTRLLDSLAYPWQDVFERDPSVGRLFEMYGLAVVGSHRGRGIATELVRQALKVAEKADCDAAFVVCTNAQSKKIFDRWGFKVIGELEWSKAEVEGKIYFDNVAEPTVTAHYKKLK